jgi:hypothetical protein
MTMLNKRCPFGWVAIDTKPSEPGDPPRFIMPFQGTCPEKACMAWVTCDDDRAPGYCQLIEGDGK